MKTFLPLPLDVLGAGCLVARLGSGDRKPRILLINAKVCEGHYSLATVRADMLMLALALARLRHAIQRRQQVLRSAWGKVWAAEHSRPLARMGQRAHPTMPADIAVLSDIPYWRIVGD